MDIQKERDLDHGKWLMIRGCNMEKIFRKLVRDRIPEIIEGNGETAVTRILDEEEYRKELYRKLLEEGQEVVSSKNSSETLEELADVYEVLRAIASLEGKNMKDVEDIANQKKKKRGAFQKRIFLEKTK